MYKQHLHPVIFLLLTSVAGSVLAQAPAPSSSTKTGQPVAATAEGVYLYVHRTPSHIRLSSSSVFQQVKEAIVENLAEQHVAVRKVEEDDASALLTTENLRLKTENQKITHAEVVHNVLQKARLAGASHVLFLTVDRPATSWVKLEMQCFDLLGTLLWEETASNITALTGSGGLKSVLEKMKKRLAARTGQPGLAVQSAENASARQPAAAENAPAAPSQALPKESGLDVSPAPRVSTTALGPGQASSSAIAQDAMVELPEGTPVRLMLIAAVNSMTASVGDRVEFRVLEDVKSADLVVIPRKAVASGVVTELTPPRRRQRPGQITVKAETVSLINNQTATLHGLWTLRSGNRNVAVKTESEMADMVQLTSVFALPFLPLFMLKHGEYVVLPAGIEFPALLDRPITVERAAVLEAQPPPLEQRHGDPVVTVYDISTPPGPWPKLYCGKAELAQLQTGTSFQFTLPPGKYWFRTSDKKHRVPLTLEDGGEYYLRLDSMMTGAHSYLQLLRLRDHDIGEVEAVGTSPLDAKHIKDISKIDRALLSAEAK